MGSVGLMVRIGRNISDDEVQIRRRIFSSAQTEAVDSCRRDGHRPDDASLTEAC